MGGRNGSGNSSGLPVFENISETWLSIPTRNLLTKSFLLLVGGKGFRGGGNWFIPFTLSGSVQLHGCRVMLLLMLICKTTAPLWEPGDQSFVQFWLLSFYCLFFFKMHSQETRVCECLGEDATESNAGEIRSIYHLSLQPRFVRLIS